MESSPPQRLLLDVREVRDRTRLRLGAAVPAFLGGLWLLWISDAWLLRVLALAGLVFGVLWVVLARRSRAQVARAEEHYLDIGRDALQVCSAKQLRTLPWSDIEAVEIDEDRLVVLLRLHGAGTLPIEPIYGKLSLEALAETLQRAKAQSAHAGPFPP